MKKHAQSLALIALAASALPASAAEIVLGFGQDDLRRGSTRAQGILLQARTSPFASHGGVGFGAGAAIEADTDGDIWAGAGPVAIAPFGNGDWRIVASIMVGGYGRGSGNDLGAAFPMFRSEIGFDVSIAKTWRVGLSINHKSNAGTSRSNVGVETVSLTLGHSF